MTEAIPTAELQAARRRLCRRIAALAIRGMAETDADFASIARRIETKERTVKGWIDRLIAGNEIPLRAVSDIFFAMGLTLDFSVVPKAPQEPPDVPDA